MPRKKNPTSSIPVIGDEPNYLPVSEEANASLLAEIAALRARNHELEKQVAAPLIREAEKPRKSGTVSVACKIPQGLRLQLQHPMERLVPTGRGGHDDLEKVTFNVFGGPVYHVFGPSLPAQIPQGYIVPKAIEGGYAITDGIPADFWEQWLHQNRRAEYVTNGMIFALDSASTKDKARDQAEIKSGLEPLSQEMDASGAMKDSRLPKPLNRNVSRIGYDDRMGSSQRIVAAAD